MSDRPVETSEFSPPNLDEVLLSDSTFETDPSAVLVESADPQKLRFQLIQWLAASPNRRIKSKRKKKVTEILSLSVRQIERLEKQYHKEILLETTGTQRSDKGAFRTDAYWQDYIRDTYKQSLKEKHPLKPADIVREVKRHAFVDLGLEEGDYPHQATVYRILKPLIEQEKRKKKIRNPGAGSWLAVETRDGKLLKAEFSNQILQCDHTKLDIRIVDNDRVLLTWRPWLTTIVDTFSSSVVGFHLWHKQPGAHEVALTLRHAALPKQYPPEYDLETPWQIRGLPLQYFFTDGGKDLSKSKLIRSMGKQLGFQCELRDRPIQGGIIERLFKTIITQLLESLPGYQPNRATKEAIEKAEKEACLSLEDLDKILTDFLHGYNNDPYPKDPRETRFERWFRGMGNRLPEPIDERQLDICLMKEEQRTVQAHGSIYFENLTYRCEALRSLQGEYVNLRYDPDHILTLYVYSLGVDSELGEFIGYAHAINMDTQDLSLYELKQLNKVRSTAKREHSNYDALLSLDKRQKLVSQRKEEKKERQQSEQKKLRGKSKKNSKVVELRDARRSKSTREIDSMELLPERIMPEQIEQGKQDSSSAESQLPQPSNPTASEANSSVSQTKERHQIVIPKGRTLKRIW